MFVKIVNLKSKIRSKKMEFTLRRKSGELSPRKEPQTMNAKNKHMDYVDRLEMQECLNKSMAYL